MNYQKIASQLHEAQKKARQIAPIIKMEPELTIEDAYKIQLAGLDLKKAEGRKVIGMKIGLTSKAMQNMLGVNEPDYGHLTDDMMLHPGQACQVRTLIQPKIEGELAFCLKKPLKGPGVTMADVYNATAFIAPALEIVDSRIQDWKISLADTIADNGSSAALVLGGVMKPADQVDLRLVGMILEKNGELVNSGCGAEVLGHPAASVAWLANKLAEFGLGLEEGHIILSGAVTAALPVQAGDSFTASFTGLGSVGVRFV